MNKKNIIEYVIGKVGYDINNDSILDEDIVKEVENSLLEIETARNIFNAVDDPKLIEVAIYSEEIAKQRFDYLISIAKARGISVTNEYIIEKFLRVAE